MKVKIKKIFSLLLSLTVMFGLCGCTLSDSGEHYMTRQHAGPGSELLAEDWVITGIDSLRMAVMELIHSRTEEGSFTVSGYNGDLDDDLRVVSTEIASEEPMGVFAVSSLIFEQSKVLFYHRVGVSITYKQTKAAMDSVKSASNRDHLIRMIDEMIVGFEDGLSVMVPEGVLEENEDVRGLIMERWRQHPTNALELREISCDGYPKVGGNCIIDVKMGYLTDREELLASTEEIKAAAADICLGFSGSADMDKLKYILSWLKLNVETDREAMRVVEETGGGQPRTAVYTAKGALIDRKAAEDGITLAAAALCEGFGMDYYVAVGTKNGRQHSWIETEIDGESIIFDPTSTEMGMYTGETVHFYPVSQSDIFEK